MEISCFPVNSPNASLMLGQRLRRWPNIKPASGQRRVFAVCLCRILAQTGSVTENLK